MLWSVLTGLALQEATETGVGGVVLVVRIVEGGSAGEVVVIVVVVASSAADTVGCCTDVALFSQVITAVAAIIATVKGGGEIGC